MMITSTGTHSQSYGLYDMQNETRGQQNLADQKRTTYGIKILEKMDDKAYRAFENATIQHNHTDKELFANALEKNIARNAANQYTLVHDVDKAHDIEVVYAFFEAYQDVVSTEEIKHLLNTKLQSPGHPAYEQSKIENFFNDYLAQLGGRRSLDILV